MVRALPLAFTVFVVASCQRTPEEPSPAPVTTASVAPGVLGVAPVVAPGVAPAVATPATANRCVVETPAQPPAGVAPGPAPGCPPDPGGVGVLPRVTLAFPDAAGIHASVELTRTEPEHERGLMYRTHMDEDEGMIFRMERTVHSFWMHNTCIPLDLLFLDTDGFIVGIVENAPTLNDEPRSVSCPSSWVLEMNAGWSRRHGVKAGQRVTIPPDALR